MHKTATWPEHPKRSKRTLSTWLTLALLAVVAGAQPARGSGRSDGDLVRLFEGRGLNPERVIVPFALSDEIRLWAHELVPRALPAEKKLEVLAEALLAGEALDLEYSRGHTGTAQEVFEDRRANCLAFTNLFLGMARELGVGVYFLEVNSEIYRKEGDLVVLSNHIAVGYGWGEDVRMYDFSEREGNELRYVRRIPDHRAVAMFYSNRGAEVLQDGRAEEAVGWWRTAVAVDPDLAKAWTNLGVGLRRLGDFEGAERAYKRAIEIDPRTFSSYHNLATLLRLQERDSEARDLERLLSKSSSRNPYTYLALGDLSFQHSRLDEARRFYRRAVHLSRGDGEPYAALGEVAAAAGDLRTARKMLRKARKLGLESHRTLRLSRRVAPDGG